MYSLFNMSFAQASYAAQAERYQRLQEQRGRPEWFNEREKERQAYWAEQQMDAARRARANPFGYANGLHDSPYGHKPQPQMIPQIGRDHWTLVLRLPRTATVAEIKRRYRELAKLYHADVGGDDKHMAELNAARDQALADKKGM